MAEAQDTASKSVQNVQSSAPAGGVAGSGPQQPEVLGCCHLKDGKMVDGVTEADCFSPKWGGVHWHKGQCKP